MYEITYLNIIGIGRYSRVYRGLYKGKIVAIKAIKINDEYGITANIINELNVLKNINHPNIIKYYDYIIEKDHILIIMEYIQDTLLNFIARNNINRLECNNIFLQLLDALLYLEQNGYYHGDLSSKNIMIDNDYNIKLIDFGSSRYIKSDADAKKPTIEVCPYELLSDNNYDKIKIDVWSLACVYYLMLTKDMLFDGNDDISIRESIINNSTCFKRNKYSGLEEGYMELIQKMTTIDYNKRYNLLDIYNDNFVKKMITSLKYNFNTDLRTKKTNISTNNNCTNRIINLILDIGPTTNNYGAKYLTLNMVTQIENLYEITNDELLTILLCYTISCKLIYGCDIDINAINNILTIVNIMPISVNEYNHYTNKICDKLGWRFNCDIIKLSDYIKKDYLNLVILLMIIIPNNNYSDIIKGVSLYIIIMMTLGISIDYLINQQKLLDIDNIIYNLSKCIKEYLLIIKNIQRDANGTNNLEMYEKYKNINIIKEIDCEHIMKNHINFIYNN